MKYTIPAIALSLTLAAPVQAQEDNGLSQMERGAQDFLEGLLREMQPAWQELQGFLEAMGPALEEVLDEVQDWSVYEPPEILDNGDIIIRRKPDSEPEAVPETPSENNAPIEL